MAARKAYTAVVAGSTGAVGRALVAELVGSDACQRVLALTRREVPKEAWNKTFPGLDEAKVGEKLEIRKVDFETLSEKEIGEQDRLDAAFWCLGGTGKEKSKEEFRKVDVDYLVRMGNVMKAAKTPYFGLVTSYGVDQIRWLWYMRVKAECEEKIKVMQFERTSIFRPAFMLRGNLTRPVEKWITPFFPSVTAAAVAKAMVLDYETGAEPLKTWSHWDIRALK